MIDVFCFRLPIFFLEGSRPAPLNAMSHDSEKIKNTVKKRDEEKNGDRENCRYNRKLWG
jgi:hypothetical protein